MSQDTGKFRKNTKDQYYTKESVAKDCLEKIQRLCPQSSSYQWIEPSAGSGVFLRNLPSGTDAIGIDIDPKYPGLLQGDFLNWTPSSSKQRIVFGNPPFGRQGCQAKAFLKHACEFADIVAFILPRSFQKPSMTKAIPLKFHCLLSEELPKNSFTVNEKDYDVPCVFQIWQKQATDRALPIAVQEQGFAYVKSEKTYNIALKRVGGLAGQCALSGTGSFNPQYHYFLLMEQKYVSFLNEIVRRINHHTFPSNTTGPRSLSKSEVNEVLNEILEDVYSESS